MLFYYFLQYHSIFSLPVLAYYFRKSSLLSGFFLSLAIVLKAISIIILIGKNFYIWIDDSFFHFIKYAQLNPKYYFGFGEKNYSIFSVLDYFHIILMLIFSPIYYLLRTKAKIYLFLPLLYILILFFYCFSYLSLSILNPLKFQNYEIFHRKKRN